jgi:hypothetical protein
MKIWMPKWAVEEADGALSKLMRISAGRRRSLKHTAWLCAS